MSPTSDAIERMAERYGVPAPEMLEFFLERAAIREHDGCMSRDEADAAALEDAEIWAKLWVSTRTPQPSLKRRAP